MVSWDGSAGVPELEPGRGGPGRDPWWLGLVLAGVMVLAIGAVLAIGFALGAWVP